MFKYFYKIFSKTYLHSFSSVYQITLSILVLPIISLKLDAIDFANLGICSILILIIRSISENGISFLVYRSSIENFPYDNFRSMIIDNLLFNLIAIFTFIIFLVININLLKFPYLYLDISTIILVCLGGILTSQISSLEPFYILNKKINKLAGSRIAFASTYFVFSIFLVYFYLADYKSILIAIIFSNFVSFFILFKKEFYFGKIYLFKITFIDSKKYFLNLISFCVNSFLEAFQGFFILIFFGKSDYGGFFHAQQYYRSSLSLLNSISTYVFPKSLEDVQNLKYVRTSMTYAIINIFIVYVSLIFLFYGNIVVNFLTNNIFDDLRVIITLFFLQLICMNSFKIQTAYYYQKNIGIKFIYVNLLLPLIIFFMLSINLFFIKSNDITDLIIIYSLSHYFSRLAIAYTIKNQIRIFDKSEFMNIISIVFLLNVTLFNIYLLQQYFILICLIYAVINVIFIKKIKMDLND